MRLFERENIVHAVADHRHVVAGITQQLFTSFLFLLRRNAPEDRRFVGGASKIIVTHLVKLKTRHKFNVIAESGLLGERGYRLRVVTRNNF